MADIKDQLIKDSYNYVLQSDLTTGVVYRIGGSIPVNPIFSSGLTVNDSFTYSNGSEQPGYVLTTDGTGYAYWSQVSGGTGSSGNYLPLSGGTVFGNTIFTSGLTATTLTFDTITAITPSLAKINWNQTDKTLEFGYGDGNTTIQIGQEMVYPPVVNKDSIDLVEGTLVMVDPTDVAQGNRLRIVRAVTNGTYPSQFLVGILTENISKNNEGYATWFGYVRNLNIPTLESNGIKPVSETWVEGNILYPNPNTQGGLTINRPGAPAIDSTIAAITSINGNNLTLLVRPLLTFTLTELNDIALKPLSALTDTSVLSFSSNTGVWVDRSIVGKSGVSVSSTQSTIDISFTGGTVTGNTIFTSGLTATTISANTLSLPFTTGSVVFQGSGGTLSQNNSNLFWNNTNNRLGIGTSTPNDALHVIGGGIFSSSITMSGGFVMTEGGNVHTFTAPVTNRTIRFITNSQSYSLFPTGNFTIGTTTDAGYKLDVNGTSRFSGNLELNAGNNGRIFINNVYPQILFGKTSTPTWSFFVDTENAGQFEIGTGAGFPYNTFSSKLYISTGGNIGIGTIPSYKLDVAGTARISGDTIIQGSTVLSNANGLLVRNANNVHGLSVTNDSEIRLGKNQLFYFNDISSGGYQFTTIASNSGVSISNTAAASRPISFSMNTGEILRIHQNYTSIVTNNFLIGTTTDAGYKLDVNGTARVSGTTTITPATLTGSAATSALDISQTWNTTGTPIALKVNITDTASAALSDLINLQVGGVTRFRVVKTGFFSFNTGGDILGNLCVGGSAINTSSQLEVRSTTKGFLPPRMTSTQRDAISSPATGLTVYQTTDNYLSLFNGTNWQNIVSPNSVGNVILNSTSGNTLIGKTTDTGQKLQVSGDTLIQGGLTANTVTTTGTTTAFDFYSSQSSGDEGGEIRLNRPATNTTVSGGTTIDMYQNKLRIFESGGTNRGVFIDLTRVSSSVGTNLIVPRISSGIDSSGNTTSGAFTIVSSVIISANTFTTGDVVSFKMRMRKSGTNGTINYRMSANSTLSLTGSQTIGVFNAGATIVYGELSRSLIVKGATSEVFNTSITNVQNDVFTSTSAVSSLSIDWTVDQYILFNVNQASNLDTTNISYYSITKI